MDDREIKFPSGVSVAQLKRDAKRLAAASGVTHTEALNQLASRHGGSGDYASDVCRLRGAGDGMPDSKPESLDSQPTLECVECGSGGLFGRFIKVANTDDHVHRQCISKSNDFGFCWCCGEDIAYQVEDLNRASECDDHAGESSMTEEEEEDAESLAEYHLNHQDD